MIDRAFGPKPQHALPVRPGQLTPHHRAGGGKLRRQWAEPAGRRIKCVAARAAAAGRENQGLAVCQEVNVLGQAMLRVRRERHDIGAVEPGQTVRRGQPFVTRSILFERKDVGAGQPVLRAESFELRPVDPIEPILRSRPEVTHAIRQQVAEGLVPDGGRIDRSEIDEIAAIEAGQANPR